MAKYRSELTVPIEYDRRSFSDRCRERFLPDHYNTVPSRNHSPSAQTGLNHKSERTMPWHYRFSDGSKSPSEFTRGDEWFDEMRRRFDERRKRWDEDVRQMREDFFAHRPSSLRKADNPPEVHLPRSTQFSKHPFTQEYFTGSDGKVYFTVNFDVSEFRPEEINVSIRGKDVIVSAKSEQNVASGSSCREYSRTVRLPDGADDALADSTLTSDGVLTFCCPMKQDFVKPRTASSAEAIHIRRDDESKFPSDRSYSHRIRDESPIQNASFNSLRSGQGFSSALSSSKPKYRVEIPIDPEYLPGEIQIRTLNRRIYITARHQERSLRRTAVKEFSKEYDIPDNVDPESLRARLEAGVLCIEST